jgi:hypothetical protein
MASTKLQGWAVHIQRALRNIASLLIFGALVGCSSLPKVEHKVYPFPAVNAFVNAPPKDRPYSVLGWVRAKTPFVTMDPDSNLKALCANYYNKAVASLLVEAKKAGGDAVAEIRSVTFLLNGKVEEHVTPECSDDGGEGEILVRGVAIRFARKAPASATPKKPAPRRSTR